MEGLEYQIVTFLLGDHRLPFLSWGRKQVESTPFLFEPPSGPLHLFAESGQINDYMLNLVQFWRSHINQLFKSGAIFSSWWPLKHINSSNWIISPSRGKKKYWNHHHHPIFHQQVGVGGSHPPQGWHICKCRDSGTAMLRICTWFLQSILQEINEKNMPQKCGLQASDKRKSFKLSYSSLRRTINFH